MKSDSTATLESDRFDAFPHPRETQRLLGHQAAETEMLDAYRSGRLPHAWLVGGPEGIGKATLAWRLARFVLAYPDVGDGAVRSATDLSVPGEHPAARRIAAGGFGDVALLRREVNEKTGKLYGEIRVDDVRRASALFRTASRAGGYRVCIIDSAEDLNTSGANALLKLIEEPPPLSLFLIVSHRPAQLLPTIRSRCRSLMLQTMVPADIIAVLGGLGRSGAGHDNPQALGEAAERGGGSVRGALHWLGGERLSLYRDANAMLARLPDVDWRGLHKLADRITATPDDFPLLVGVTLEWIHDRMRAAADAPSPSRRRLAPLGEVWDKIRRSARDAETYNLDKRAILLSIFADLAQATRPP